MTQNCYYCYLYDSIPKLGSVSGLLKPIFFNAAVCCGKGFWPGSGFPEGPTLNKIGFSLPPYSWGAGKVPGIIS